MEIFRFMTVRPPQEQAPDPSTKPVLLLRADPGAIDPRDNDRGEQVLARIRELEEGARFLHPDVRDFVTMAARFTDEPADFSKRRPPTGVLAEELEATPKEALIAAVAGHMSGSTLRHLATTVRLEEWAELGGDEGAVAWSDLRETPIVIENLDDILGLVDPEVPRKAHFGPVGVGDLHVVEQRLLRYELGDVAHIENVMRSEFRERNHRKMDRSVERILEVEESTIHTEEDLQTAERFDLQSETEKEIRREQELSAGLTVTASYGPTVEATATFDFSTRTAKRTAERRSSNYAREITARSLRRVTERIKEERETTLTREVEEHNIHRFDNAKGTEHSVGVYRYVDKVYEAQLVNYGKRLLFEFFVPQPAAWLRWVQESARSGGPEAPPAPPRVSATSINRRNYRRIARDNGVGDPPPPPPQRLTVSETCKDVPDRSVVRERFVSSGKIQIPDGYSASQAFITVHLLPGLPLRVDDDTYRVIYEGQDRDNKDVHARVAVGRGEADKIFRPGKPGDDRTEKTVTLDDQVGEVPYYLFSHEAEATTALIEIECDVTEDAMEAWRGEILTRIWDAYQKELSAHAEAVGGGGFVPDVPPPPARLREIERLEMKRRILEMLGQEAKASDPMAEGDLPLVVEDGEAPLSEGRDLVDMDLIEELAAEIRFGEQAFEWGQMTYQLYPYFWADPDTWAELALLEHQDPLHAQFLRAGAARVLVPVRPGFEEAVHHFLMSGGEIAREAEAPDITSPTWLPLYEEIQEAQGRRPDDVEVLDCWNVRLPTTLVMLSPSDALPENAPSPDCVGASGGDEEPPRG